jgi:hypothetical protein
MAHRVDHTPVPIPRKSFYGKLRDYNSIKSKLSTAEPELDFLAEEIYSRMQQRKTPFPKFRRVNLKKKATVLDVKRLLLYLDHQTVPILLDSSLSELLEAGAPFSDPQKGYHVVYNLFRMIFARGKGMNHGEMCHIANILINEDATNAPPTIRPIRQRDWCNEARVGATWNELEAIFDCGGIVEEFGRAFKRD